MKKVGIIAIVIGVLMMIYTGFTLVTKKEVADIGPIEITKQEKTPINWSPILGVVLLVAGTVIVVTSRKS
ncbi:MAG TPA: hypothetical protein VL947_11085 [Cytophagales bacterium]|nr:hypothetical protein [Cytophagales bacterium]